MKKYILFFLVLSTSLALHSAIFTVTNTNAAGAGSFAEAAANANATAAKDTIEFDIPGIAPHTIPGAYVVFPNPIHIDGDSQPANGYTGAGKKIIYTSTGGAFNAFYLQADDSAIKNIQFEDWGNGILVAFVDGYTIEGNAFIERLTAGSYGINANFCSNGLIKNNLFGKEEEDGPCVGLVNAAPLGLGYSSNLVIEGNEMCKSSFTAFINLTDIENSTIQGNTLDGNISGDPADCISLGGVAEGIVFSDSSTNNQIGGYIAGEENIFIDVREVGIRFSQASTRNFVGFNAFYCTTDSAIRIGTASQENKLPPEITFADGNNVIGTADPGDKVAVYRSTDNTTLACGATVVPQSDLFYGEVTADGTGNWALIGTFEGFLTATATDANNNTSIFADIYDTGIGFTNSSSPCFAGVLSATEIQLEAFYESSTGTLLSWRISDQSYSSTLKIQRSRDLQRWLQIGDIQSGEDATFTDNYPPTGLTYYRIQQVKEDGSTILSSIVSVFVDAREWTEVQVFPNPATDMLTIIPQNHSFLMEETTIELFSLQGERVLMDKVEEASSARKIRIDHLPKGVYLLRINSESKMLQQKISIL